FITRRHELAHCFERLLRSFRFGAQCIETLRSHFALRDLVERIEHLHARFGRRQNQVLWLVDEIPEKARESDAEDAYTDHDLIALVLRSGSHDYLNVSARGTIFTTARS